MEDVVIIGAGAAGLTAAGELRRAGLAPLLMEARDRIGGRVFTVHEDSLSAPIELGAEFVHEWPDELIEIIQGAGLPTIEIAGEHWRARDGALKKVDDYWERISDVLSRAKEQRTPDRSFSELLDDKRLSLDGDSARLALNFVEGFHAADARRVSERSIAASGSPAEKGGKPRMGRFVTGYDGVVRWLARELPSSTIRLGTIVTRVEWREGRASVHATSADGRAQPPIETRAVLVTVPLGVLSAMPGERGAIAFDPEVEIVGRLTERLAMGSVVRITVALRERFWEGEAIRAPRKGAPHELSFLHLEDDHFPVWWTTYPLRSPLLIGWTGGPRAGLVAQLAGKDAVRLALDGLAAQVGIERTALDELVTGWWHHDWVNDPFARGAYSYTLVGGADDSDQPAPPAGDTIFFAGEATAPSGRLGTVDGAIASGTRAAKEIANALMSASGVG